MEIHLHAHPQIHCIRQNDQVDLQDVSDESDGERLDQSFSLCSLLHTQHVFFSYRRGHPFVQQQANAGIPNRPE